MTAARTIQLDSCCPATRTLVEHVTSKWGVLVLIALAERSPLRWSELKREIPGVSEKMLIQTLQTLEADGLVLRTAHPVVPPHVEYSLTDDGTEAHDLLAPLVRWAYDRVNRLTGLAVTWWGHASATVEVEGVRVATDPLLGDRLLHLRRYALTPPATAYDADLVLLSHLHHDHLHLPSLRRIPPTTPILVPRGGEGLLASLDHGRVHPVGPGDVVEVAGLRVTVLAATHDGRRGPHTRIAGPPLGFRVDGSRRSFWFPGDTELRDDMHRVGSVDLALVPIGGWGPTLEDGHMDPVHGAEAVARVGAGIAVPVHWGTFWPLGLRRIARANHQRLFVTPGDRFLAAMAEHAPGVRAVLVAPGTTVDVDALPGSGS